MSSEGLQEQQLQSALVCRAMDWAGDRKGIRPFQGKSVTKYYFHCFSRCPLVVGQLSIIYHFSMGRNSMFERQNGF